MTSAFCPAHITCFFRPSAALNVLERGSAGVGIRLTAGTTVHVDEIRGSTKVIIDGRTDAARITRHVLGHMAPSRSFEVSAECGLPPGQGFGMSASGAVAAALCMSEITGKSRREAFEAAHTADAVCGGGLGDVAGLMYEGDVPVRTVAGLPPFGSVTGCGISFERITLAVLGRKMSTAAVLGDADVLENICRAGGAAMDEFKDQASKEELFRISDKFSREAGIRGPDTAEAIRRLGSAGIRSAMCMLGNSIFTDAPEEEVRDILGTDRIFSSASTGEPARIIRKA